MGSEMCIRDSLCDLRKDMSIPADAVPVVLSLLDRLHETRRELQCLAAAVDTQPDEVRRAVLDAHEVVRAGGNG